MPEINYGSPVVSGDVQVTLATTPNTVSVLASSVSTTGNTTMGTVGSGKQWRIIGIQMTQECLATNGIANSYLECGGTVFFGLYGTTTATYGGYGMTDAMVFDVNSCPVLSEGETVIFKRSGNTAYGRCHVFYIEETA